MQSVKCDEYIKHTFVPTHLLHYIIAGADGRLALCSNTHTALQDFNCLLTCCQSTLTVQKQTFDTTSCDQFALLADDTICHVLLACQHTLASLECEFSEEGEDEPQSLVDGQLTDHLKLMDRTLKQISLSKVSSVVGVTWAEGCSVGKVMFA